MALLYTKDVAEMIGIHRHQVERLVRERKLPTVQIPGMKRYRFTRESIEAFIQSNLSVPDDVPIAQSRTRQKPTNVSLFHQGQKRGKVARGAWRSQFRAK